MKKQTRITITGIILLIIGILLHVFKGNMFSAGTYSLNYFASGDYACGVFAAGKFSVGIFSIGIFSIGIFSIGIFNIAIYAIGLFVYAHQKKLPDFLSKTMTSIGKQAKTVVVILACAFMGLGASAQETKPLSLVGGFGGPMINANMVNNGSLSFGGGGAAVFSNGLFVGGFGMGTSDFMAADSELNGYKMKVEYGGLWVGYIKPMTNKLNLTFSLKAGGGEAQLVNSEDQHLYYDPLMVLTPEIAFSWKPRYISAIQLGVYYNLFNGIELLDHESKNFSGPGMSLMFKFGGGAF